MQAAKIQSNQLRLSFNGDIMFFNPNNQKTVAAIGKFDTFHTGHCRLIRTAIHKAKEENALSLIFFIGSHSPSVISEADSVNIVKELGVDLSFRQPLDEEFRSMSADDFVRRVLLEQLNCACVVVGYNFRFAKGRSADASELKKLCEQCAIECIIVDEVKMTGSDGAVHTVSSSLIRSMISQGRVDEASCFLGRPYPISGRVVKGRHLGTSLGVPTANLIPPDGLQLPADGVYATRTIVRGKSYLSVTNIGANPTVADDNTVTVETNILDFEGNVYDEEIKVEFLERVRGEKRFSSFDELKAQIDRDVNYVKNKYLL